MTKCFAGRSKAEVDEMQMAFQRPTLVIETERGILPLLVGFLYEIQPLGRRNKWRGRRVILEGGRESFGQAEPFISERTRFCHVRIDVRSTWIEPEDLVLVGGQLDFMRVGDWITLVYPGEDRTVMRRAIKINGFGVEGVFSGCLGTGSTETHSFRFMLHDGTWTPDLAEKAAKRRAHGVALLRTLQFNTPDYERAPQPYEPRPLILRQGSTVLGYKTHEGSIQLPRELNE